MSNQPPKGNQTDTINRFTPFNQMSFDLARQDAFAIGQGIDFLHYKAMPSPIGKKDRGDYRRSDGVDTISSNGMIYRLAGQFTASMVDNTTREKDSEAGQIEASEARLILPRFYVAQGNQQNGKRIYLHPGDRIYIADPNADTKVATYHEMDYEPSIDNVPVFPIAQMDGSIIDSRNIEYFESVDFQITPQGNIHWLPTGKNPGIDPETGKGRVYSLRYLYKAFWYVISLPKEVRMSNVTTNGVRAPERMAYHAVVQREYLYRNQNRGNELNQNKPKTPERADLPPEQVVQPNPFFIPVDMGNIGDGNQS